MGTRLAATALLSLLPLSQVDIGAVLALAVATCASSGLPLSGLGADDVQRDRLG
jgi:hypothetical protein